MSSERLPGKVLMELGGRPALELLLSWLDAASEPAEVVVATSTDDSDDPIAEVVHRLGFASIRGPLDDVLERYRRAAERTKADAVVRITADCPLIDPAVVDLCVARWRDSDAAYVANVIPPRSFPTGMGTEVITASALVEAAAAIHAPL